MEIRIINNIQTLQILTQVTFYFDGLVQERCNSIANALELHLSRTNLSIYMEALKGHVKFLKTVCVSPH